MDSGKPSSLPALFSAPDFAGATSGRKLSAAAHAAKAGSNVQYSCELGSNKFYAFCGLGGFLACGITHFIVTPLDIVKCRMQVDPEKYRSLGKGFKLTYQEGGARNLMLGWAPTAMGYAAQGTFKYGLYEVFKNVYAGYMGEENAFKYRTAMYLVAGASAEFFGDIALSPFEAVKVRIQTSPTGTFPTTLRQGAPKIWAEEGIRGFYKSIGPLWGRQIPYTMTKFACFERTVEAIYKNVVPKPKADCTKVEQLVVTFSAGYIAGIVCAVVSHPPDTIVSYMNKAKGSTFTSSAKALGFMGLWKGLVPRTIMIGTLTALQWFIYDVVKVTFSLPRPPPPEMPDSLKKKLGLLQA